MRRVWEDAPKTLDVILQDCSEVDLTCLNYHWPSPFMCGFASMVLWGGAGHSIKSCQPIHTDTLTSTLPRLVLAGQHRWHDNQGFSVGCFDDGCFMLFHVVSCCFMLFHVVSQSCLAWDFTFSRASNLPEAAGAHDLQMELRFLRCSAVTWRLRMGDFTAFTTKMIQDTHLMRENGDWPLEFGVSTQFPDKPIRYIKIKDEWRVMLWFK